MEELLNWFTREGGTYDASAFKITEIPGKGRGAIALKDLPADHCLFAIPRELTLSLRTSRLPSFFGQNAWEESRLGEGWTGLILCMMWEEAKNIRKTDRSKWDVYLDSLPSSFDTPMFWNKEELEELRGTSVLERLGKEEAERNYHEKLLPAVRSRPDLFSMDDPLEARCYSLEKFHIMGSRILSRSFHVEPWVEENEVSSEDDDDGSRDAHGENDQEPTDAMDVDSLKEGVDESESDSSDTESLPMDTAMVPLADMLNASVHSENAVLVHEPMVLKMTTTKEIRAGEEILNTYNNPPNSDLLRQYGYVDRVSLKNYFRNWDWGGLEERLLGNPLDVVDIPGALVLEVVLERLSFSEKGETANGDYSLNLTERIDWWLEEGGDDVFVLDYHSWERPPEDLISFTRLLLAPVPEWGKIKAKGKPPKAKLDMLTIQVLKDVMTKKGKDYPSTYEDDLRLHSDDLDNNPPLPLNSRNAVIVRLGERLILRKFRCSLEQKENELSPNESMENRKRRKTSMETSKSKRKRT